MDEYTVKITKIAHQNIATIRRDIIAKYESAEDADTVEEYIYSAISGLNYLPRAHGVCRYANRLSRKLYFISVRRKYHIYYTVNTKERVVTVVRVIHRKRDIRKLLNVR